MFDIPENMCMGSELVGIIGVCTGLGTAFYWYVECVRVFHRVLAASELRTRWVLHGRSAGCSVLK